VHTPFPVRVEHDGADPFEHQLHGRAARPCAADLSQVVPRRARHVRARDVRLDPVGLAEDPRVDDQRARAERAQPVAHVADLGALGIEGADQRDAGILRHGS
jgi:hypothetical protein